MTIKENQHLRIKKTLAQTSEALPEFLSIFYPSIFRRKLPK